MTTPNEGHAVARGLPPITTTPGTALAPYPADDPPYFLGPLEEAIARQNAILAAGTYTRPPQLHPLGDGRVLLVTEVTPGSAAGPRTAGQSEQDPPGFLTRYRPYILAVGAVLAVITGLVLLLLFGLGLIALVQWGQAHALAIGAGIAMVFIGGATFLVVVARGRSAAQPPAVIYPPRRF